MDFHPVILSQITGLKLSDMISFILLFLSIIFLYQLLLILFPKNKVYFHLLVYIALLSGLRSYNIGNDTFAYFTFFNNIKNIDFYFDERIEIGFRLFTYLLSSLIDNFTIFLLIYSFLLYFSLYQLFNRLLVLNLFSILLVFLLIFIPLGNVIRQAVATVIMVYSINFILFKKNYIYFLLFVIIASLFHLSALFFILILPFTHIRLNRFLIIATLLFSSLIVFSPLLDYLIENYLPEYFHNYIGRESGLIAILFNVLLGGLPLLISKNRKSIPKRVINFLDLSSLMYVTLFILSYRINGFGRIGYFFLPFLIANYSLSIRSSVSRILLISILVIFNILVLIYRPEWNSFFPYDTIF